MPANKYNGKNLSLMFDGTEEFSAEGTSVTLDNEEAEGDTVTFEELGAGSARTWFFTVNAIADYGTDSFWTLLWDNSGQDIAYLFKPYGNTTASPTEPHFSGTCTVLAKPPIGGTAGETWAFEARLDCTAEPTRVTA